MAERMCPPPFPMFPRIRLPAGPPPRARMLPDHILNTGQRCSSVGAFSVAESARPMTSRVATSPEPELAEAAQDSSPRCRTLGVMSMDDNELDLAEAVAAVERLFPAGPIGDDVASELRGDGWTVPIDAMAFAACVGEAIWSVFSNNHDVISPEGRVVSLGTWRGS